MKKTFSNACILLLFGLLSLSNFAQNTSSKIIVTGTVVDMAGVAVPGVNIVEKGTANGVVTDFDGNYKIPVKDNATLVFSFIGLKTLEVAVKGQTLINVTLQEDTSTLDEVVVVGYGTQKRQEVTGSVATVKMSEIEDLPVGNLASALVGRVLGVSVSGGEARPGNAAQITIRNPQTFAKDGGSNSPLYVIDGVIQIDPDTGFNDSTQFNNLDASEVESISFLKDASAAIYGSRSAQGVVLVKTKRGKKGPAKFSYTGNYSIADETYRTRMMNAYEYGKTFNILNGPGGAGQAYDPASPTPNRTYFFTPNELEYFKTLDYDFLEDNWTSAISQRHNANITGGGDTGTYFAGISFYTQEGNLGTLNYDRWSFRAGSNVTLARGFTADFQVSGYFTDQSKTFNKVGGEDEEDDFQELQNRAPFLPMYINGLPVQLAGSQSSALLGYHYEEIQRLNNLAKTADANVTVNANVEYEIPFIKGLKIGGSYSRLETHSRGNQLGFRYPIYEFNGPDGSPNDNFIYYESGSGPLGVNTQRRSTEIKNGDRILIDNITNRREQTRFQSSYARDFGKHSVSAFFAIEKSETSYNKDRILKEGAPIWSTGMLWQATGALDNTFNWAGESGDLGYIGRANYNYDEKYFAEFLFRSDASAKFAPNNYWGKFYSVSGGWIISKEAFFKSNTIDFLKFKGSVGLLGKDDVKAWSYLQKFGFQIDKGAVFGGDAGVSPGLRASSPANAAIHWSDELKTNFGFEAAFLDNRLSTNIETYYNIGTNIFINLNQAVPFTVGGATTPVNYGEFDTWGTEISLGWSDNVGKDFSYGANFNIGWSNNKLIKGDFADTPYFRPWENKPGQSTDIGTWGYDYVGMFKTQADIDNYIADTGITQILGKTVSQLKPGMLYYRDVRGAWDPATGTFAEKDGIVDVNDQVQLKKRSKGPTGFSSTFRLAYKQFSLNTVLSVDWGGYNLVSGTARNRIARDRIVQNAENRPAFWANMYDEVLNPTGTIPNMHGNNSSINMVPSEFWEVSSLRMNIRNINLSYSLPKNIAEKLSVSSFKLNLVAINPFILFNPYKDYGLPPDGTYDRYPILKTYSLGLSVGF